MEATNALTAILENPWVYRLWQAPFANQKLEPIFQHNDVTKVRRVLDVGSGPGTNARHFTATQYLGLDLNPSYVEFARRRYRKDFRVADVTQFQAGQDGQFDFILMNSLLHHIDDAGADHILSQLTRMLSPDGRIHILDLVLPDHLSIALVLARKDRGQHPRPLAAWRTLFERHFKLELFEPYPLRAGRLTLWNMVYFRGSLKG